VDQERNLGEAKPRLDWTDRHSRKLAHDRQPATPSPIGLTFATLVGRDVLQRPSLTGSFVRRRVGAGRPQEVEGQARGDGPSWSTSKHRLVGLRVASKVPETRA